MTHARFSLLILVVVGCRTADDESAQQTPFEFVVEALSRGKGVPEAARAILESARSLAESAQRRGSVSISEERIGLEGEIRLRLRFADGEQGRRAYAQLRKLAEGVDLIVIRESSLKSACVSNKESGDLHVFLMGPDSPKGAIG